MRAKGPWLFWTMRTVQTEENAAALLRRYFCTRFLRRKTRSESMVFFMSEFVDFCTGVAHVDERRLVQLNNYAM
jgi:hypothetical protein